MTKLVGSMKLVVSDDAIKHHSYIILHYVFDPNTSINILVVPDLETFFGDNADALDSLADNGITTRSGSTKSHYNWYHGRHKRHILHGSRHIP